MSEVLTELVAKISTDASGLKSGLSDAESATEKSSQNMADSLKKVGIAMVAAGTAVTAAMGLATKSAMDAVESENLFNASLGKNAKVVRDWSNALGKALGLNTYELRKNTGTIYVMVQSMGIASDAAMDMSEGITELAYDMASFYNISPEEAFGKLKSGLVGMSRPLQDLGILVNETTIKAYALKTGMIEQGQEMTEQQKVTARYGAILQATTVAQGDLARTMDSPTNKLRVLSSTFDELKIVIGENLLPIIGSLLTSMGNVLNEVINWAKENPALARTLTITATAVGVVSTVVGGLILLLPTLISGVAAFGVVLGAVTWPITLIVAGIGLLIAGGILLWKNWDKVSHFFAGIWSNIKSVVLHAVDAILEALKHLVGWLPFFGNKIAEAREKLSNMIEAEKIKRDIADVKEELIELEEVTTETADTTRVLADTLDPKLTAAMAEVEDRTKSLQAEEQRLSDRFADLMRKLEDAESESGKLGLTMDDVYTSMYKLGYKTEQINDVFRRYGDVTEVDEVLLDKLGITAEDVARLVGKLKDETDKGTESLKKYGEEAQRANDAVSKTFANLAAARVGATTGGATGSPISEADFDAIYNARQAAVSEVMAKEGISRQAALALVEPETYGSVAKYVEAVAREAPQYLSDKLHTAYGVGPQGVVKTVKSPYVGEYATGGVVPGTIGAPALATVHGGETIIPANESMGGVTVNISGPLFMEREDQMNQLVDKIRKGIQRQDRLRFGGAYNG
uniref:Putative tail tape measure protein n=1 Tax=viral metagenome TaxID=1070528 RepID=A0A6M3KDW0_9ZZZZ